MDSGVASVSQEKFLTSSLKAGRGEANKFLRNELRCKSEKINCYTFWRKERFLEFIQSLVFIMSC